VPVEQSLLLYISACGWPKVMCLSSYISAASSILLLDFLLLLIPCCFWCPCLLLISCCFWPRCCCLFPAVASRSIAIFGAPAVYDSVLLMASWLLLVFHCCWRPCSWWFLAVSGVLAVANSSLFMASLLLLDSCCCWRPCYCWFPAGVNVFSVSVPRCWLPLFLSQLWITDLKRNCAPVL
jgi:hypothetical protein